MATAKEIIKALRCTATVHTEAPDCEHCPYVMTEHLTGLNAELFGDVLHSCDIDRIGFDAADMLENMIELGVL